MNNRSVLLFFIIVTSIYHSCKYELNDVYQREILDNVSAPTLQSVNLDLNADTLYINNSNLFAYNFNSNKKFRAVRFILDNNEQYLDSLPSNSFNFTSYLSSDKLHYLTAQIFVGSGSQSIGDIIGTEGYSMSKTWIVKVNPNYNSQSYSYSENGYLHLTWPRYYASDFKGYSVYRLVNSYPSMLLKTVYKNNFTDSSYVGEGGKFFVTVLRQNKSEINWGDFFLTKELPATKVVVKDFNKYYFTWGKSKYYNAVDTFRALGLYATCNPNDTMCLITKEKFGETVDYSLKLIPKRGNLCYTETSWNYTTSSNWTYLGYPYRKKNSDNIYAIRQINNSDFTYFLNADTMVRYSTALKKITEKKTYVGPKTNIGITPLRKNIVLWDAVSKFLTIINPLNFIESASYDISNIAPTGNKPVVSDNNILITTTYNNLYIYDLNQKKILLTYAALYSYCSAISSKGDYLLVKEDSSRIMQFSNLTLTKLYTIPTNYSFPIKYFEFNPLNAEQFIYWNGKTFYLKQCSNFSTINQFDLGDSYILSIDYYNNKMLCYNDGHLLVRGLSSGKLQQDIPVNMIAPNIGCILINNTIVSGNGVMYLLN